MTNSNFTGGSLTNLIQEQPIPTLIPGTGPNANGGNTGEFQGPFIPGQSYTDPEVRDVRIGKFDFETEKYEKSTKGAILRYPYEALTDETDYLQIDIRAYNSVASLTGGLTSDGNSIRKNNPFNPISGKPVFDASPDFENGQIKGLSTAGKDKFKSAEGSILLPMPSNIQDGNSVSYASGNLDGITAKSFEIASGAMNAPITGNDYLGGVSAAMAKAVKGVGSAIAEDGNALKRIFLADLAAQAANIPIGGSLKRDDVFARTQGEILNQNVELLFNGVTLRSFKFSFKFTPRGPKEAQQVGLIINTFKRNMAAKVGGPNSDISKNFLGTPNVFELTYKRGANSHPFLHSFKQCVLTDMSVNYTGEGTYAVYDDSTPVSMVLELGFKELEPIYDADYGSEPGVGY